MTNIHRVYDPWGEFLWWEDDEGNVYHGSEAAPDDLPGISIAQANGGKKPAKYEGTVNGKPVYSLDGKVYIWDGRMGHDVTGKAIGHKEGVTTFSYDEDGNLKKDTILFSTLHNTSMGGQGGSNDKDSKKKLTWIETLMMQEYKSVKSKNKNEIDPTLKGLINMQNNAFDNMYVDDPDYALNETLLFKTDGEYRYISVSPDDYVDGGAGEYAEFLKNNKFVIINKDGTISNFFVTCFGDGVNAVFWETRVKNDENGNFWIKNIERAPINFNMNLQQGALDFFNGLFHGPDMLKNEAYNLFIEKTGLPKSLMNERLRSGDIKPYSPKHFLATYMTMLWLDYSYSQKNSIAEGIDNGISAIQNRDLARGFFDASYSYGSETGKFKNFIKAYKGGKPFGNVNAPNQIPWVSLIIEAVFNGVFHYNWLKSIYKQDIRDGAFGKIFRGEISNAYELIDVFQEKSLIKDLQDFGLAFVQGAIFGSLKALAIDLVSEYPLSEAELRRQLHIKDRLDFAQKNGWHDTLIEWNRRRVYESQLTDDIQNSMLSPDSTQSGSSNPSSNSQVNFIGNSASNEFKGNSLNNYLEGKAGGDNLFGNEGDDILIGGKGTDALAGGTGNDTYIYYKGDDGDVIKDIAGEQDTLEIHGITSSDITYEVAGDYGQNLIMKFATENDEDEDTQYIIIEDFFTKDGSYTTRSIENIILKNEGQPDDTINVFDDIVTPFLSAAKDLEGDTKDDKNDTLIGFRGNDTLYGKTGDDTLDGGYGDDTLTGGEGDDTLYGGTGNDTYHYVYDQDGSDVISDRGYNVSGVDKLIISGINPAEADAIKLEVRGDNSEHLLITFKNDETLFITDYFKNSPSDDTNENTCVEEIFFEGFATTWTKTTIEQKLAALNQNFGPSSDDEPVFGTNGNNIMQGGHGDNTLNGGAGDDTLYAGFQNPNIVRIGASVNMLNGGYGKDKYIYNKGDGICVIEDEDLKSNELLENPPIDTLIINGVIPKYVAPAPSNSPSPSGPSFLPPPDGGGGTTTAPIDPFDGEDLGPYVPPPPDPPPEVIVETPISWLQSKMLFLTAGEKSEHLVLYFGRDNYIMIKNFFYERAVDDESTEPEKSYRIEKIVFNAKQEDESYDILYEIDCTGTDIYQLVSQGQEYGVGDITFYNDTLYGTMGDDLLFGGAGEDTLEGGRGDDTLYGGDFGDTLSGGEGDDTLYGEQGDDKLYGGRGNDKLKGGDGYDTIDGGEGDDEILGGKGNDTIDGGKGNDVIYGNDGDDQISGGLGNDIMEGGAGDDTLAGGIGDDTYIFRMGEGHDTIAEAGGAADTLKLYGINPNDIIFHVVGKTLIMEFDEKNSLTLENYFHTESYDDTVINCQIDKIEFYTAEGVLSTTWNTAQTYGSDAWKTNELWTRALEQKPNGVTGSRGNDRLEGTSGNDTLNGGYGHDRIQGNTGNDTITGGKGVDILEGGAGEDTYIFAKGDGHDTILDASAVNTLKLEDFTKDDLVFVKQHITVLAEPLDDGTTGYINGKASKDKELAARNDLIIKVGESDAITIKNFFNADGTVNTSAGISTILLKSGSTVDRNAVAAALGLVTPTAITGTTYTFSPNSLRELYEVSAFEFAKVSLGTISKNDVRFFRGTSKSKTEADAKTENDLVLRFSTAKQLIVRDFFSSTTTANPNKVKQFVFSDGIFSSEYVNNACERYVSFDNLEDDVIDGNFANDILYGGFGNDTIAGAAGNDVLHGEEGNDTITGGTGDDTLYGGKGHDSLSGNEDNDTLYGGTGNDTLSGGKGNDELRGDEGDDALSGDEGNDTLYGGAGKDTLSGGTGDDTLIGGIGDDVLMGGKGNDTYRYTVGDGNDIIRDARQIKVGEAAGIHENVVDIYGVGDMSNVKARAEGHDLVFEFTLADNKKETLTIENYFYTHDATDEEKYDYRVAEIRFYASASSTSASQVWGNNATNSAANYYKVDDKLAVFANNATDYDDVIIGNTASNTISGGKGDDKIMGFDGDDVLHGNQGNDLLFGGKGNDTVNGGFENDLVYGEEGNDTLNGGVGDDIVIGGKGDDTYIYQLGHGHDIIRESVSYKKEGDTNDSQHDRLVIYGVSDINNVKFEIQGNDLRIIFDKDNTILLEGYFFTNKTTDTFLTDARVEVIDFYSGMNQSTDPIASYTYQSLCEKLSLTDGVLNSNTVNTIRASNADEARIMQGAGGNDTYAYTRGHKMITVYDRAAVTGTSTECDTLVLNDIRDTEVTFVRDGAHLIVRYKVDATTYADAVKLYNYYLDIDKDSESINTKIEQIQFKWTEYIYVVNGTTLQTPIPDPKSITWNKSTIDEKIRFVSYNSPKTTELYGTLGNDIIVGNVGADTIEGAKGNDEISGGTGDDKIYGGEGNDTISGNEGDDTISGGEGDDKLWGNADNDTLSGGDGKDKLYGGEGNDTLYGGKDDDELRGGKGYDTLDGGSGSDIYYYSKGDGNDVIRDSGYSKDVDKLVLEGILPSEVILSVVGDENCDLRIEINVNSASKANEYIILENYFKKGQATRIEEIRFGSLTGTLWDYETVYAMMLGDVVRSNKLLVDTSNANNYTFDTTEVFGNFGNDTLSNSKGDDIMYGGIGADTYIYTYKDTSGTVIGGQDWILNNGDARKDDTLVIKGFDPTHAVFEMSGENSENLVIKFGTVKGNFDPAYFRDLNQMTREHSIGIQNYFSADERFRVNKIVFEYTVGSQTVTRTIEYSDIYKMFYVDKGTDAVLNNTGNNVLHGKKPYAILDGGTADDMLVAGLNTMAMLGGSGNDTYVYHYGDGKVWIKDEQGTADKLILNTISGKNATMYTVGNHAVMYFDESNYVVIENHNLAAQKLEHIEQRVSTVIAPTTLLNMEIDSFEYSQLKFDSVQEGSQIRYSKGMGRVVVNSADYTKIDTRLFISGYAPSELKYYQIKRTDACGGGTDPMTGESLPWTQEVTNYHLLIKFDDSNYILLKDYYRVAARNDIFRLTSATGTQITQSSTNIPTYLVNELSVGTSVNGSDPVQVFIKGTTSDDSINDTAGNNRIYTMTGDDTVHLSTGDDIVYSDSGAKTYNYHYTGTQKDGRDWIITHDTGNGDVVATDDILNIVGANKNKVTIETTGAQHEHLILRFDDNNFIGLYNYFIRSTGETDSEQFKYMFKSITCDDGTLDQSEFESVRLKNLLTERGKADGHTKTIMGTHLGDILTGVNGEEYISGGAGDDIIDGGRIQKGGYGNDIMKNGSQSFGGVGDDIYESTTCFDYEGGSDTYITSFKVYNSNLIPDEIVGCTSITDKGDSQEVDRLILKGVKRENVSFEKYSSNLLVKITEFGGVRINDYFAQDKKSLIEEIIFESGEILRYDDIVKSISAFAESFGDPNSKASQFVVGNTANNTISGGFGDDVLMGGKGNDTLKGGEGNDTYVFNRGDGNDLIIESGKENYYGNKDIIVFGDGILPKDILIARNGNSLILSIKGTDDAITIFDCLAPISSTNNAFNMEYRIEEIHFNNGTVWNFKHLVENITEYWGSVNPDTIDADLLTGFGIDNIINAREGHDTIYGREGNDTLIGGKGNDKLYGGNGNDTYIFNLGDGQDTILDDGDNDYDTIRIASSIHRNNTRFSRSGDNGEHLLITFANSEDKITVQNFFHAAIRSKYRIERIIFDSNGEEITAEQLYQMPMSFYTKPEYLSGRNVSLYGYTGAYKSVITGDEYENTLEGSKGDDVLSGFQGEDTYVFRRGFGKDVIYDTTMPDYIALDPTQPIVLAQTNDIVKFIGYAPEHAIIRRVGDDLKITFADADDELTIQEYFVVSSRYENKVETIIFENNGQSIVWNIDAITANLNKYNFVTQGGVVSSTKSNYIDGKGGSYNLNGSTYDDILDGKDGNDVLNGGAGNDTYVFGRGYGNDIVVDADAAGYDTLLLKGLVANDIVCYQTGNDLTIKIIETDETVTLQNFYSTTAQYRIENIRFSDNTTWSTATLLTKLDTVVSGTANADTINISSNPSIANRYVIKGEAGNDTITGTNYNDVIDGGEGNDTLVGGNGDDYLIGGAGNDFMYNSGYNNGADTYIFRRGQGNDTISDGDEMLTNIDRLIMVDIKSTDVTLERLASNKHNLVIKVNTGETLTINWYLWHVNYNIEQIIFSDGVIWSRDDVMDMMMTTVEGTAGNDTIDYSAKAPIGGIYELKGLAGDDTIKGTTDNDYIYGGEGNDVIYGNAGGDCIEGNEGNDTIHGEEGDDYIYAGSGNDTVYGGSGNEYIRGEAGDDTYIGGTGNDIMIDDITGYGNDMYIFNRGDGQDRIVDYGPNNSFADKLVFGNDIAAKDVVVTKDGDHLILKLKDSNGQLTGDQIRIDQYLSSNTATASSYRIEQIVFADGTIWTYETIQAMLAQPASVINGTSAAETLNGDDNANVIYAGDGNDIINAKGGDDAIYAGAGNDTISAGTGNNLIDMGTGNDFAENYYGNDTYIFKRGYGSDRVVDYGNASNIDKVLMIDIKSTDVILKRSTTNGNTIILQIVDTGETIQFDNQLALNEYGLEEIVFADNITWSRNDILNKLVTKISGTANNDVISIAGNPTITGVYQVNGLAGNDTITGTADSDRLYGDEGDDTITGGAGADVIDGGIGNDTIYGNDGSDYIFGNAGNDTIDAGSGSDYIESGAGDDIIIGGTGNDRLYDNGSGNGDTYIFDRGCGNDWITDLGSGVLNNDKILFGSGILPTDIAVQQSGSHLWLFIKDQNGQLTNDKIQVDNYLSTDTATAINFRIEQIVFADGTIWTYETIQAMLAQPSSVINGTSAAETLNGDDNANVIYAGSGNDTINANGGNDIIYGGDGNDRLNGGAGEDYMDGGAGNDYMVGGTGKDTYIFRRNNGNDTINDNDGDTTLVDKLIMYDIKSTDVTYKRSTVNPNNLIIELNDTHETITIDWMLMYDSYNIEQIIFADNVTITKTDIMNLMLNKTVGTTGNDVINVSGNAAIAGIYHISGMAGNDTITGSADTDRLFGNEGDDTINGLGSDDWIEGGDGNDIIHGGDGQDNIHGDKGNDIIYGDAGNDYFYGDDGHDKLYGGDGIDYLFGGNGDDELYGGAGNDFLYGQAGNDYVEGGTGNDVYMLGTNYGTLVINDNGALSDYDKLWVRSGLTLADVEFHKVGDDLEVRIKNTSDKAIIKNFFNASINTFKEFKFDASYYTLSQLTNQTVFLHDTGDATVVTGNGVLGTFVSPQQSMSQNNDAAAVVTMASVNNQVDQLIHAMAGFGSPEGMMSPSQNDMTGKKDAYIPLVSPSDMHSVRNTLS